MNVVFVGVKPLPFFDQWDNFGKTCVRWVENTEPNISGQILMTKPLRVTGGDLSNTPD